jgi:hypothetical protein
VEELRMAFRESVNDYLTWSANEGKTPNYFDEVAMA